MSLPRSIDAVDVSGAVPSIPASGEVVLVVGPRLQTPKDTSIVLIQVSFTAQWSGTITQAVFHIRQGTTIAGTPVGATYGQVIPAGGGFVTTSFLAILPAISTDYVQVCFTAAQTGGSVAIVPLAATIVCTSW